MELQLSNVINISVSATPLGISNFNTSNLGMFTDETAAGSFGSLGYKIYLDPTDVGTDFGTGSNTFKMANAVFSQQPNILAGNGYLVVILLQSSETLDAAITRTIGLVQYFGVMSTAIESQADMLAAAAVIQPLNKVGFFVQKLSASIAPGGSLDLLRSGSFSQSRGLYYGSILDIDALVYQASYAGRALSVNFAGSNTTMTMQLKTLISVQPDPTMTQTLYNMAKLAGADIYPNFQGSPGVACFGANAYYDSVYNLGWFVGGLEVAGFNFLKQSSTKLPQTENGMDGLKGAYRGVCQQSNTNAYSAPGQWNSPNTFGNQGDFLLNISQLGYYIFSLPIALQAQADRVTRAAPLVQIALKEAGAIHSSTVIVNVNP